MAKRKKLRLSILLELFLNAFLLTLFVAQAFVATYLLFCEYVPFPSNWGNRLIAQHLPADTILQVDEFRLRPGGSIDLVGIDIKTEGIQQPLLKAKSVKIELKWDTRFDLPQVKSLVLSAGILYIPSVYSSDGFHSPLLERITFRVIPNTAYWEVDRFAALHENIHLRGAFQIPIGSDTASDLSIGQKINAFYAQAAKLSEQKESIHYFQTPTIAFKMSTLDAETQQVDLRISSRQLRHSEVIADKVQLRGSAQLKGLEITPITAPRLTAEQIQLPRYELAANGLSAEIKPDQLERILAGDWPKLKLAAQNISCKQFNLEAPILTIDPSAFPQVAFRGASGSLDGAIDLRGHINTKDWSGQARARGSVDLVKLASQTIRDKLPAITYESSPYYDLNLSFEPGFSIERVDITADVNNLQIEDLTFDHIDAHAIYTDGLYSIEDLYLRRDKQWLDLKFNLHPESDDYQISLIGSAIPDDYNALLPSWWAAIFKDFEFNRDAYIWGDFIIYGNYKRKASDLYFGRAEAQAFSYKGVYLDQGELIVRGRGHYTELHKLKATSGQAWARGNIAFASKSDEVKGPAAVRLNMEAQLTLEDATKLFSGNIAQIISDFKTEGLPRTKFTAAIFNSAYPQYAGKSFFDLSAVCAEPLSYKGMPLEHLSFDLFGRGDATYLRYLKLGYAGGQGSAAIDIFTPAEAANQLRYQFELKDAEQNKALRVLPDFDEIEDSLETRAEPTPSKAGSARIDINLHGEGPFEDPFKHAGFGRFEVRNDQLGAIQLLGPLSKILQNTQLNFTSFNLNLMRGDFSYKNENVFFDPLRIDGPRTQIQAPGHLRLTDHTLEMRVSVSLFGNAGNPGSQLRKIGDIIIKPLPNLLQFQLTGTLEDQILRSLYDPRNLIPRF